MTSRCCCPTLSEQRALAIVGSQLGLYGLELIMPGSLSVPSEKEPETWDKDAASGEIITPSTPGAVPVVPGAWNFETSPYAKYRLQWGDTMVGLAATYLGAGARWQEIWKVQDASYKQTRTPDKIFVDDLINMPAEAAANAKAWIDLPPGERPEKPGDKPLAKPGLSLGAKMAIGGGLAVVVTGIAIAATQSKKKRAA
jgi:hypothetical protein